MNQRHILLIYNRKMNIKNYKWTKGVMCYNINMQLILTGISIRWYMLI